jgi:hypothetical protein
MFYYALFSWLARPDVPPQSRALTYGEASGVTQLLPFLAFILTLETTGVHLIVQRWSQTAAWILTALGAYALIWLLALWRSMHLRPILLTDEKLTLRVGYLFEAEVPRAQIASWRSPAGSLESFKKGLFRNVRLNDPQFLIELSEPVTLRGPFGISRQISKLALAVDCPTNLKAWLMLA